MSELSFVEEVLSLPGFRESLSRAAVHTLRQELPMLRDRPQIDPIDWNFALMCASALTAHEEEAANEAVLRIAQSCLQVGDLTTDYQKAAALLLLEREGNVRAKELAGSKGIMDLNTLNRAPLELRLDAGARVSQLTVESSDATFILNSFQKEFWDKAQQLGWLSISAPTSAGKSFIVKTWIKERINRDPSTKIVYLAPTRALIEEVNADLRGDLGANISVQTLPWNLQTSTPNMPSIFVFTQERLHIHLSGNPDFAPDFVFVDEAQNLGSSSRGILLSQVISECASRNPLAQVIFASPLSNNPEILVASTPDRHPGRYITGESVTVTQNLIYVNQLPRKGKLYGLRVRYRGREHNLGTVELADVPTAGQKLAYLAKALGGSGGNLIYANGPAEAESCARQIFDLLGEGAENLSEELADLSEFIRETVHEKYLLATYVRRGVAFHYGDIPLNLKLRIEEQFKKGNIKYLACTSTLLEGVNLPCRNIFIRNPKKGISNDMSLADFWNLAGRAGRWGTEFQGNIFCIDTDRPKVWKSVPTERIRMPIKIAANTNLDEPDEIISYIAQGAPKTNKTTKFSPETESALSFVSAEAIRGRNVNQIPGLNMEGKDTKNLDSHLNAMLEYIALDHDVIARHFGISPMSMERLRKSTESVDLASIQLVDPRADDAFDSYRDALAIIDEYLGGPFGNERYRLSVTNLLIHWMRGRPLRSIIEGRAKYQREHNQEVNYPKLIRTVLGEVEKVARFEAPKYLSCFSDIVNSEASRRGTVVHNLMDDIRLMLELGVTRRTDMSLIANGLSRSSAMHVGQLFQVHDLDESSTLGLLLNHDFEVEDLPPFVTKEVRLLVQRLRGEQSRGVE